MQLRCNVEICREASELDGVPCRPMGDDKAPSTASLAAKLQDRAIRMWLMWKARQVRGSEGKLWRSGVYSTDGDGQRSDSQADVEDMVGEAIVRALDANDLPWTAWSFRTHMTYVLRRVWDNRKRLSSLAREVPDEDVTRGEKGSNHESPADEELHYRRELDRLRRMGDELLVEIADKDPIARRCLELGAQGFEQAAEQADRIGCSREEVYRAHERLKEHGLRIRKRWEMAELRRMRELQSSARRPERAKRVKL